MIIQPRALHFDSPETSGKRWAGSVQLHMQGKTPIYTLATDEAVNFTGTSNTTNTDESSTSKDTLAVDVNLGLHHRIDLLFSRNMLGVKVQLTGQPSKEKTEGLKAAAAIRVGDLTSIFIEKPGSTQSDAELSITGNSTDIALIAGYRFNPNVLVYINLFKQKTEAKGTITDNNGVLLQAISGTNHVKGSMYGVAFDVSDYSSIMIEGGWVRSSWDTLAEESFKPYGLNFIRKW